MTRITVIKATEMCTVKAQDMHAPSIVFFAFWQVARNILEKKAVAGYVQKAAVKKVVQLAVIKAFFDFLMKKYILMAPIVSHVTS